VEDTNDPLIPVFMPALIVLLENARVKKGSPLTKDEVLAIRNSGVCMMMKTSMAIQLDNRRGYSDLDPEKCWEQWCEYLQLNNLEQGEG
jgi:hypothetical protein